MHQATPGLTQAASAPGATGFDAFRDLGGVTFVGQSHVECMRAALSAVPDQFRVVNLWHFAYPVWEHEFESLEASREYLADIVVSGLVGSAFEAIITYRHPWPFDFISPHEPDAPLDPGAELIPFDAVHQLIIQMSARNLELIDRLRGYTNGLLLQMECPPPWGHHREVSDWPAGFAEPTESFAPRYLRRKVRRLYNELVRSFCAERDIEVISPPPETIDAEGFLLPEFSNDPVHANEAYGRLYAERILRRIATLKGLEIM